MSKCPVCGRTGLVGKEREIVGTRAVTIYKCHGCDNSWRVRDEDAAEFELPPRDGRTPPQPPARQRAKPLARTANTPRIVILSVTRATDYQPHGSEVCISITDPSAGPVRLSPKFSAVLRVSFSDIASPSELPWHVRFSPEHARAILHFVDQWPGVERLVIHCTAGLSRSPAVGMGICELQGWPLQTMEADYPQWNTWVRSELLRVGRESRKVASRARPSSRPKRR
jgi:hypothetical protein